MALHIPVLGGLDQHTVKIPPPLRAEQGQLVPGKAVHRGAQGGNQGHILAGVVHDLEDGQRHIDLSALKEVPAPVGGPGDVLLVQRPEIMVEHRVGAAQEDHHVGGPHGPQAVPLLDHQGLVQQLPDPAGRKAGLQEVLALLFSLLLPKERQVQRVQLQGVGADILPPLPAAVQKRLPRNQRLIVGIVQLPELG